MASDIMIPVHVKPLPLMSVRFISRFGGLKSKLGQDMMSAVMANGVMAQ